MEKVSVDKEGSFLHQSPAHTSKLRLVVYGILALMIVGTFYVWYSAQSVPIQGVVQTEIGTLYFSGVPDNEVNLLPNIFSLSIPSGEIEQVTGVGNAIAFSRNYVPLANADDEFLLLPSDDFNEWFSRLEPVVIFAGTANNTSENNAIPKQRKAVGLHAEAGFSSHSLTVAPNVNQIAYVTQFPEDTSTITPDTLPDILDFETWTVVALTGEGADVSNVEYIFEAATRPLWFTNNYLLLLRTDAIYAYDFIADITVPLVTAESLGFSAFSTQDSIMVTSHSDDAALLVYKHDTAELIVLEEEKTTAGTSSQLAVKSQTILPGHEGRTIYQLLRITDTTFATLQVSVEDTSVPDVVTIYDMTSGIPTPLHTYSMAGITRPGTTMLDSWYSGHYENL